MCFFQKLNGLLIAAFTLLIYYKHNTNADMFLFINTLMFYAQCLM